ncbi:MAG: thiamine-phosphate kinase [Chloroflexota bacterium]|nr:thiamine-phosphate kinase [Chloroflexota bacterium]
MKLKELGEFELTKLIHVLVDKFKNPEQPSEQQILVGIGDDAAAWQSNNRIQIATTDTLVQDVHFDLSTSTWEELGWKALAVNLSDIAAMGGVPQYALVSLSLPGEVEVEDISRLTEGMARLASEFEVTIIGGNLTAASIIVITVTLTGCSQGKFLKRSTARSGEYIAVTGYLGTSAAGLRMLQKKLNLNAEANKLLRQAHLQPTPRVKEGQILVQQGVKTAIDISDGLIADLDHVCEASKLNARIKWEQVPVHYIVKANFPDYQELALHGGEDYEILFTANKNTIDKIRQNIDCQVTIIGEITEKTLPDRVTVVDNEGNIIPYKREGWEHFRNGTSKAKFA